MYCTSYISSLTKSGILEPAFGFQFGDVEREMDIQRMRILGSGAHPGLTLLLPYDVASPGSIFKDAVPNSHSEKSLTIAMGDI